MAVGQVISHGSQSEAPLAEECCSVQEVDQKAKARAAWLDLLACGFLTMAWQSPQAHHSS